MGGFSWHIQCLLDQLTDQLLLLAGRGGIRFDMFVFPFWPWLCLGYLLRDKWEGTQTYIMDILLL